MDEKYIRLIPNEIRLTSWPKARFLNNDEQIRYEVKAREIGIQTIGNNGSNLPKIILLNGMGIRSATIPEIYNIWEIDGEFLKGYYEDFFSVVLRSNGDTFSNNDYIAKSLSRQAKIKNFEHAYVLTGLELIKDERSPYGYDLVGGERFSFFQADEFDHVNNQRKFSRVDQRGLPIFDENGDKTLYTREGGISRIGVYRASDLDSGDKDLSYSGRSGRVIVVEA